MRNDTCLTFSLFFFHCASRRVLNLLVLHLYGNFVDFPSAHTMNEMNAIGQKSVAGAVLDQRRTEGKMNLSTVDFWAIVRVLGD